VAQRFYTNQEQQIVSLRLFEMDTTENKITELQMLEQNMQTFLMEKQAIQGQQIEVENALEEITKTSGKVYKILGSVMVASNKEDLKSDLESKKEVLALKIKTLEKQETKIRERAQKLQADVLEKIKKDGENKNGQ